MTKKLRNITLYIHNKCRDELAAGDLTNEIGGFFPKAARLREFLWDRELAFIAGYHASYCTNVHDECRNTKRFRRSGQNLGWLKSFEPRNISNVLEQFLHGMCNKRQNVLYANEFPKNLPANTRHFEDFAIWANERVSRVGCGMAYCKNCKREHCYYLTCNYDNGVPTGADVYETDEKTSASKCDFWRSIRSQEHINLCKNDAKALFND